VAGGVGETFHSFPAERWEALDLNMGLSGQNDSFWAFLIGGFFLYASYYGADQSQTQRELSAPTIDDTKKSLVFNGLARFPLTMLYIGLGVALSAAVVHSTELQEGLRGGTADDLVPTFIVNMLPGGIRALIIAAMLAAAMSSLDSALNSLSASTMRDFIDPDGKMDGHAVLRASRLTTVGWGVVMTGMAFFADGISDTIVEAINKVGSAFYGPILATFVMGVLSKRANGKGILVGVPTGLAVNIYLWQAQPQVSFWWYNLIGFAITATLAQLIGMATGGASAEKIEHYTLSGAGMWAEEKRWLPSYAVLVAGFFVILGCGVVLNLIS
jgi:Na+/proline symporter